jgi:hypothetical protein
LQRPTKEEKRFFFFIICWPRISPFFMGGKVDERFVVGWILAVRHVTVKRSGSGWNSAPSNQPATRGSMAGS